MSLSRSCWKKKESKEHISNLMAICINSPTTTYSYKIGRHTSVLCYSINGISGSAEFCVVGPSSKNSMFLRFRRLLRCLYCVDGEWMNFIVLTLKKRALPEEINFFIMWQQSPSSCFWTFPYKTRVLPNHLHCTTLYHQQ